MSDTYTITRDPETGLMIVRRNGVKIGSSQTEAAAKIIRRNDRRSRNVLMSTPDGPHVCPDVRYHKSECDH